MKRRLIIDGNAVYELDEECMLKKRLDHPSEKKEKKDLQMENSVKNKKNEIS